MSRLQAITGAMALTSVDAAGAPIEVSGSYTIGSLQVSWYGLSALTANLRIQVANDPSEWNDVRGGLLVIGQMDIVAGSQIFEIKRLSTRYFRLYYTANTNTAGALTYHWHANELAG